jgi:hypothetical protein
LKSSRLVRAPDNAKVAIHSLLSIPIQKRVIWGAVDEAIRYLNKFQKNPLFKYGYIGTLDFIL